MVATVTYLIMQIQTA